MAELYDYDNMVTGDQVIVDYNLNPDGTVAESSGTNSRESGIVVGREPNHLGTGYVLVVDFHDDESERVTRSRFEFGDCRVLKAGR
ncbi:hypothetical protein [Endozoicomonas acroporae]|uniref:hypothetical protein n=1 Tax=Endozoicomonas acroporae TaxID=1701104 RepID=UPI0013D55D27|nr:hypothetical protein [Endozoicomonas acroporae]